MADLRPLTGAKQTFFGFMSAIGGKADLSVRRAERLLMMRWTAPATGIAMCQIAVAMYEPLEGKPPMSQVVT